MKKILFIVILVVAFCGTTQQADAGKLPTLNKWTVECTQDPMTDEKSCTLGKSGRHEDTFFSFTIMSQKNSTYFAWITTGESCKSLEMRVDDNTKIDALQKTGACFILLSDSLTPETKDIDLYMPYKDILAQIKNGKTITARYQDIYGHTEVFKIDLAGLNEGWVKFQAAIANSLNDGQQKTEKK